MITVIQFVAGFVLLLFGAEYLVRGAVALARKLRVAPMIIGMTIVAYGTTAPELVVSLQAAVDGLPGISVGNVVGSNIANILLILGLSAVIFPIVVQPTSLIRDAAMCMGAALVFTALALSGTVERWQGALMVAMLATFSIFAFMQERRRGKANDPGDMAEELTEEFKEPSRPIWLSLLSVVGGIAAVVAGAKLLVAAAVVTARTLGVDEAVIGLTIVAVGTSLPELATAVVAAIRKHSEVAVGNILGAGIYNLFAIMGLVAVVTPIPVPAQIIAFDLWFMVTVTALLLTLLLWRNGLSRPVGAMFLAGFVVYTALQYLGVENVLAGNIFGQAAHADIAP
ncbi:MAG: calcium/sodium antiporter [Xanthobacteraceae bacterium]